MLLTILYLVLFFCLFVFTVTVIYGKYICKEDTHQKTLIFIIWTSLIVGGLDTVLLLLVAVVTMLRVIRMSV